jgi:uncharacterized protein (DUF169 family)
VNYRRLADQIASILELDAPPVALSFVEPPRPGVSGFAGEVPSACAFWRRAESGVFYAPAEKHFNCPVGALTMGFDLTEAVKCQLEQVVEKMVGCSYPLADEPQQIPAVTRKYSGIVYGPLIEFQTSVDLVLMWLSPRQAMLFSEAAGTCRWTESWTTAIFGRPGCAALPVAKERSQPTLSLGCTGLRTFTEISHDRLLAVVPGDDIERFVASLEKTKTSNEEMGAFYAGHTARFW